MNSPLDSRLFSQKNAKDTTLPKAKATPKNSPKKDLDNALANC